MYSPEGWWTAIRSVPHELPTTYLRNPWFHFVTNASVTSQTGEEGLAIRICQRRLSIFGHMRRLYQKRHQLTPHYTWLWILVQAVNRTSDRSGSASEDDPAERGCSRSRTTLGSTPTTPGGSHMTASLGGHYDSWPVKRSTDWLSDWLLRGGRGKWKGRGREKGLELSPISCWHSAPQSVNAALISNDLGWPYVT